MARSAILAAVCGMLVLGFPSRAAAEQVGPVNDGRALISPEIMQVIKDIRARNTHVPNSADAQRITDVILADGVLDRDEIDLIDELTLERTRIVTLIDRTVQAEETVTTVVPSSRIILLSTLDRHYADLYGDGPSSEGWQGLVGQSLVSRHAFERVRDFLGKKAAAEIGESQTSNAYKPARDLITSWFRSNQTLAPDLQDRGRWLIHLAFKSANDAAPEKLPEFIYNWTRPTTGEAP